MNLIQKVSENWKSGVTVALVSLPLSVSLAIASQATPVMGIVTAVWAGLIASIFGGSNFNIVGPTGALSGVIAAFSILYGIHALPVLAIISGILILIAYFLRFEKYLAFIPGSAIQGFTLGVAFIIAFNQFNSAFGLNGLEVHEKFTRNLLESFTHLSQSSLSSFVVFAIFLVALFVFAKYIPKIPGAIVLAPIGILIGFLSTNELVPLGLTTLGMKFSELQPVLFLSHEFKLNIHYISPALTVAIVAILETMISAKIADSMTQTKHHKRKEMLGLSLANIGSGLMGGIPATAALARTSLNIKSGANSKISATISSLAIVVISFIFLKYFKYIPMAVIASILVFVAIRMIETHYWLRMIRLDRRSFFIALAVAVITIVEDPIIGILGGATASLLLFIENSSRGQFEVTAKQKGRKNIKHTSVENFDEILQNPKTIVYTIKGSLVYMNGEAHLARFEKRLNGSSNVIVRLVELSHIDLDGVDILDEIIELITNMKKNIYITGASKSINNMLVKESNYYSRLKKSGFVFAKTSQAIQAIEKGK